jgi:hypothetical protein
MPPEAAEDVTPADKTKAPPTSLSPLPTVTYTDPPRPERAAPEPICTDPVPPFDVVPELRMTVPLTPPEVLPGAVIINNAPLDEALLDPVKIDTMPPEAAEDVTPADKTKAPPTSLSPLPTVTYTDPPRPDTARPLPI